MKQNRQSKEALRFAKALEQTLNAMQRNQEQRKEKIRKLVDSLRGIESYLILRNETTGEERQVAGNYNNFIRLLEPLEQPLREIYAVEIERGEQGAVVLRNEHFTATLFKKLEEEEQ